MRSLRRLSGTESGVAAVEFGLIAPVLVLSVLAMADVGLAIHESFEIDQSLRNGAEAALGDPGEPRVEAVLEAVDTSRDGASATDWTVERYCACPGADGTRTDCTTTCSDSRATAIFYAIRGTRAYRGIFLPDRVLERTAKVQIR